MRLGSMGKRRIRLLKEMYPEFQIYGIGRSEDKRATVKKEYGVDSFSNLGEINISIDCAFVSTSPLSHAELISECLKRGWNVFTELNLVHDRYDENIQLARSAGLTLFLSSTFLYREEIRYIRSKINPHQKWNYIYHIGQYLPDWHPWESYKDFFIGDQRTNGCREIMAIELPWLTETFGNVCDVNVISDKMTGLDIDYKDNYMIQLQHDNGNKGTLIVDVVSPCAVRKLEAYSEGHYITWSGTPDSLAEFDSASGRLTSVLMHEKTEHQDGYSAMVVENAYKNEIREFFDVVRGKKEAIYDFEKDLLVLNLIDRIGA